ncbi:MAG TPA: tetratricopeptide repeat protein, partial [Thermoplasmata archaeon]|nr:tetratricopeptide repeat protein [Thermoplasmata archaeon]
EIISQGLKIDEKNHGLWFLKGVVEKEKGNHKKGVEYISHAIELNFLETDYYFTRGEVYLKEGRYDDAVKDFDIVLGEEPEHYAALYNKGKAYLKMGKLEAAERFFRQAIEVDESLPFAWEGLAEISKHNGDKSSWQQYHTKAVELNGGSELEV